MPESSRWRALAIAGVHATVRDDRVAVTIDRHEATLDGGDARALGLALLGLSYRVRRSSATAAVGGRRLVWADDGCHIGDEREPIVEGDALYIYGNEGWLRGICISASTMPLIEIARGVLYLRPDCKVAGLDTLVRRARDV